MEQKLILNKVFSIYVGATDSHIKFGGWDQGALLENEELRMFTSTFHDKYGVEYTGFNLGGTDIVLNGGLAQSAIFDPSAPYIYLPEADFKLVATELNRIFANFKNVDRSNICDIEQGNCFIENSCDYTKKNVKNAFGMNITLTDELQKDFVIQLTEEMMLREDTSGKMVDNACFLPFYNNKKTLDENEWVLGSIVMKDYYTVYDLSPGDESLSIGIGKKNPTFIPN